MPAVTIRLTGELRPGRGDGRRCAGSGFGRQRPSTQTVVSGWERLAAVRLRSAATAAPAVADAPSAPAKSLAGTAPRPSGAACYSAARPSWSGSMRSGPRSIGGGARSSAGRLDTNPRIFTVPARGSPRPAVASITGVSRTTPQTAP